MEILKAKTLLLCSKLLFLPATAFASTVKPVDIEKVTDLRFVYEMNYAGYDNFVGRPIKGYNSKTCYLSIPAKKALSKMQDALDKQGTGWRIKIFDCYRPTRAVADFYSWAQDLSIENAAMKAKYYPNVDKANLFDLGYIADKSGHSRGSTVDLTLIDKNGIEIDMGSGFDLFDDLSHTKSQKVSKAAQANRAMLNDLMDQHGFENFWMEWWHFTLKNEPYKDKYFNFVIE